MTRLKLGIAALVAASITIGGVIPANAITVERKLTQFGGPETRTRCTAAWIIICTHRATDFRQHEYFLVVSGPDVKKTLEQTLRNIIAHSLAAAATATAVTHGEVAARLAAAVAAFKVTFASEMSVEPILNGIKDKFQLKVDQRAHW